jgi:hypothetical protein
MEKLLLISAEIIVIGIAVGFFCLLMLGLYTLLSVFTGPKLRT